VPFPVIHIFQCHFGRHYTVLSEFFLGFWHSTILDIPFDWIDCTIFRLLSESSENHTVNFYWTTSIFQPIPRDYLVFIKICFLCLNYPCLYTLRCRNQQSQSVYSFTESYSPTTKQVKANQIPTEGQESESKQTFTLM